MLKLSSMSAKIFFVVLCASIFCIDYVNCQAQPKVVQPRTGILGGIFGDVVEVLENVVTGVVGSFANTVSNLGGTFGDLISATHHEIPDIDELDLIVYNDDGNEVLLSLDPPKSLELDRPLGQVVSFTLHTNRHIFGVPLVLGDLKKLRESTYDPYRDTVFITHGWQNSNRSRACTLMRDAFLKNPNFNIVIIDWSPISNELYVFAANMVPKIAKYVAEMMNFLEYQGFLTRGTRMVGHGLGAHVVGSAGVFAKVKPLYVTGLDPALPMFASSDQECRISILSGENVEVIHTNGGLLGFMERLGHVDFYPNGGKQQPGCDTNMACSHARSYQFYASSLINPPKFYAKMCPDEVVPTLMNCQGTQGVMGTLRNLLTPEDRGAFYLETSSVTPYV